MGGAKRTVWLLTMAVFVFMTSGCGTVKTVKVDDELNREGTDLKKQNGLQVAGYTLWNGSYHEYDGWAVLTTPGDSLMFYDGDEEAKTKYFKDYPSKIEESFLYVLFTSPRFPVSISSVSSSARISRLARLCETALLKILWHLNQ